MNKLNFIKTYGTLHTFLQSDAYQPLTDGDTSTLYKSYHQKSYCEHTYTNEEGTFTRFRVWLYGSYNSYVWRHSFYSLIWGVDVVVRGRVQSFKAIKEEDVVSVNEVALDRFSNTLTFYPDPLELNSIPLHLDLDYAKLLREYKYSFFICGNHDITTIRKFFELVFGESTSQYTAEDLRDSHNYFLFSRNKYGVQCLKNPDAVRMHVNGIFDRAFALPGVVCGAVEQISNQ